MKKFLLFVLMIVAFTGCKKVQQDSLLKYYAGEALGTTFNIRYESNENYQEDILAVFNRVNQSMSTYLPDSDISKINSNISGVKVDSLFIQVFNGSVEVWQATEGYFDPTVGPLVNAYGFGPQHKIDSINTQVIDSLMQFVGLDKVKVFSDGTVVKNDPRIFIDFNAIAKGYTVDLIGKMLDQKDVHNYLIEIGGEILAKGTNVDKNKEWVVAIDHPLQKEEREIIKTFRLNNRAMATSGNYRKFHTDSITGEYYTHTINPKTGRPEKNNILSVTVLAENTMYADAYATALMVMGFESSKKLLEKEPIDVYILYMEESEFLQEFMTDGFKKLLVE